MVNDEELSVALHDEVDDAAVLNGLSVQEAKAKRKDERYLHHRSLREAHYLERLSRVLPDVSFHYLQCPLHRPMVIRHEGLRPVLVLRLNAVFVIV